MSMERQPLRSFCVRRATMCGSRKALSFDADAVILDLEDAVAIAEKLAIGDAVAAVFGRLRQGWLYVRANAVDTDLCYGDR